MIFINLKQEISVQMSAPELVTVNPMGALVHRITLKMIAQIK